MKHFLIFKDHVKSQLVPPSSNEFQELEVSPFLKNFKFWTYTGVVVKELNFRADCFYLITENCFKITFTINKTTKNLLDINTNTVL